MTPVSVPDYTALCRKIRETLVLGQQKVEAAKVRTYHETGRLIHEHILKHDRRADYGRQVIEKLSEDLGTGSLVLWRCLKFAKTFPILSARKELSWAHYRALITVPDEKKRLALAEEAAKGEWSSRELEIEIRNFLWEKRVEVSEDEAASLLEVPKPGPFWTYRIIRPETVHSRSKEPLIDLGFSTVLELDKISDSAFKPDTVVTSTKDAKGDYSLRPQTTDHSPQNKAVKTVDHGPSTMDLLYTYQAFVERIVDGDTLKVEIDLGFNIRLRRTVRLRAIDCPEMDTPEGKSAKKFVESALRDAEALTLKTVKPDKYGRCLGDLFIPQEDGSLLYLNNELLQKGHAVKVRS